MLFRLRVSLLILALSLNFIVPALAQSQSVPSSLALSDANDLAAALANATSEEEQERLLAQKPGLMNSSLVAALKAIANPLFSKGDYAQALRIYQLGVRLAERIGDRLGLADALNNIGVVHNNQNRQELAQDFYQKALAIYEEAGDKKKTAGTMMNIGIAYRSQRRFDQALEYYEKSLRIRKEIVDRNAIADIFNKMGFAHWSMGHDELALELYHKSRALSEELGDKGTLELVLNNIAAVYTDDGRYAEALEYLLKSLKILEETGIADNYTRENMAVRLQNIGRIYRLQGLTDQALAHYRKSLKLMEEVDSKSGIANLQNNIGVAYKSQGEYEQALEWFQKSLRRYKELPDPIGVARSLNNIGDAYRLQGRHDLALENLRESLRLREERKDPAGICLTLNNLGQLYQDQDRYAETLEVSRRAAGLAEESNLPEELWKAQARIGGALSALGQPVEARRNFQAAIATIESLRRQVAGGEQQQQSFLETKLSPWLGMTALLVSQKEYAEALTFAEQSKARALIDTLQTGRARLDKSLTPEERHAEEKKRLQMVALNSQLTDALRRARPDPSRVTELKAEIARTRLEFEALQTGLYATHPEVKIHRGESSIIKTEEFAALLPDASCAAIEYVVANDATFLFAVTRAIGKAKAEIRVYTLPIKRTDLTKQVEAFRMKLAERNLDFRDAAAKLYDLMLKPAQEQLRGKTSLIIVPDDKLWDLPFQALAPKPNRFLIENAAIAYAPSLTALREMMKRRQDRGAGAVSGTLLALGNPLLGKETIERASLTTRDEGLDPLPEAEQEVKALSRLYARSSSKVYIGADASEDRAKSEAGQAGIIHFATHGVLNNASPMYSHLALAQGDANEDGLLEAWELMQLDLKAGLAVLSACETARGRFGAGEGVIGLTWALFIAGAPATVVSQWKVESAGTRELMLGFYRQLRAPSTAAKSKAAKAEALRQAALKLMKNPQTSHPFYWAGFVLVGNGR